MMDWNQIRGRWQGAVAPLPDTDLLAQVQQRDASVRAALRRRDWLETAVAVLVAPVFAFAAWRAGLRDDWVQVAFCVLLAAWAIYVPLQLWHTRRRLPVAHPQRPLLDYLREEHAAMIAQAEQLERIWLWYLAPCAIGTIGLNFSAVGAVTSAWLYAAVVLVFCAGLGRLNHRAARTQFRALAAQIEQQISRLSEDNNS